VEAAPRTKRSLLLDICASAEEPILIFTSAIATANDIFTAVKTARPSGMITSRAAVPADALAAFMRGDVDILVCTDLAAEGLNLQRAGMVVHYDVPWNPVRIDQRNGRACRIGQTREQIRAIY